jgi:amidase
MKNSALLSLFLLAATLTACSSQSVGGESSSSSPEQDCPLTDLPYPRPEPAYQGKLPRDLGPFAAALQAYSPEQVAAREALVSGKTIPELQDLMAEGNLTSVELVVYYLERIQRYDVSNLNAVLELNPQALDIARALDEERADGSLLGPLHGIPVLLKDNIATGDQLHTAAGAAAMLAWDPGRDSFLASQLRQAGGVILGKANLSEWANWMDTCMPNGFSTNGGQTQNPYGPYETFGSSSGSAVAVAADLTTVSVGSETQGSIISPAGINSVVGLKTSRGLVSRDFIIPLLPVQDVPGPMGRTVTDVAVLLSAMTGVDANDPQTSLAADLAGIDFTQFLNAAALADIRVGLPLWNEAAFEAYFAEAGIEDEESQAQIRAAFTAQDETQRAIAAALQGAGVTLEEIPRSALPEKVDIQTALTHGYKLAINRFLSDLGDNAPVDSLEAIIAFNNQEAANRAPYGQDHLEASQGSNLTDQEFEDLVMANQAAARAGIDQLFAQYEIDVIVSKLNQLYAPAGYPALSVPAGYSEDGQPQDVVFVGGFLSELHLLAVGYAYEQATQARSAPDLDAMLDMLASIGNSSP